VEETCVPTVQVGEPVKKVTKLDLKSTMKLFLAPPHSMWSDGSAQTNTNFAPDSGLDGTHCCIKVETDQTTLNSTWKGEKCNTIMHGICEHHVKGNQLIYIKSTLAL